jgi:hypothetical protein
VTPTLTIIGIALWGQLLCGVVGFAIGRITKRGPTRTVEIYKGEGVPF